MVWLLVNKQVYSNVQSRAFLSVGDWSDVLHVDNKSLDLFIYMWKYVYAHHCIDIQGNTAQLKNQKYDEHWTVVLVSVLFLNELLVTYPQSDA